MVTATLHVLVAGSFFLWLNKQKLSGPGALEAYLREIGTCLFQDVMKLAIFAWENLQEA